ncbi:MAG: BTAD domain-containing putative transcriptional regulator [Pseudomonadota bacterium]
MSLFGAFDIQVDGVSLNLGVSGATRSLLQYLLCFHGRPTRREQLHDMFWPDTRVDRRRSSLNSAIWRLRKALADVPALKLDATTECVRLAGVDDDEVQIDFVRLESALRRTVEGEEASLSGLLAALEHCGAAPLDGLADEWAVVERERLSSLRTRALTTAMRSLSGERRYDEAIEMGRRILVTDPYRECAFQEVMCLHVLNGDRARAMRAFVDFAKMLRSELEIEPMAETRMLRDYLASDACFDRGARPDEAAAAILEYASRPGVDQLLCSIEASRLSLRQTAAAVA